MRNKTPQQAEKILTAAARLFATHRFHEARMEDIAAQAEVGKGTLYRYFRDKEELYLALLERASGGFLDRLRAGLEQAQGLRQQLESVVYNIVCYFDENPHLSDLIQHAEALHKPTQEFPWQKTRTETTALLRRIMEEAKVRGEYLVEDPELAICVLLGGLRSVMRFTNQAHLPDLPARIVDGVLKGFAQPGPDCSTAAEPWTARPQSWPAESPAV